MNLTNKQLEALHELAGARTDSARTAMKMRFIDGAKNPEITSATGMSAPQISTTAKRYEKVYKLAEILLA